MSSDEPFELEPLGPGAPPAGVVEAEPVLDDVVRAAPEAGVEIQDDLLAQQEGARAATPDASAASRAAQTAQQQAAQQQAAQQQAAQASTYEDPQPEAKKKEEEPEEPEPVLEAEPAPPEPEPEPEPEPASADDPE